MPEWQFYLLVAGLPAFLVFICTLLAVCLYRSSVWSKVYRVKDAPYNPNLSA